MEAERVEPRPAPQGTISAAANTAVSRANLRSKAIVE